MKSNIIESMKENDKLAILVVHFGTTFEDTRKNTIDIINSEVKKKFSDIETRESYTSRIIMRRLKEKGIFKDNPVEALEKLKKDGYTHILIQPTNIINGIEAKTIEEQLREFKNQFKDIRLGTPLLTSPEDFKEVATIVNKEAGELAEDEAIVLVGHGTHDSGNIAYPAMDYTAKSLGYKFYVGTVEGYPEIDDVIKALKKDKIKKVVLMPFMFVAGDHAKNDIAGDWNSDLKEAGFDVTVNLTSLGMMSDIRKLFVKHLDYILNHQKEDMIAKKLFYSKQKD